MRKRLCYGIENIVQVQSPPWFDPLEGCKFRWVQRDFSQRESAMSPLEGCKFRWVQRDVIEKLVNYPLESCKFTWAQRARKILSFKNALNKSILKKTLYLINGIWESMVLS